MNAKPISKASDPDLRASQKAIERAAVRAREIATRTNTDLVVNRDGATERTRPAHAKR